MTLGRDHTTPALSQSFLLSHTSSTTTTSPTKSKEKYNNRSGPYLVVGCVMDAELGG